jgi:UDP-glucose 4-epimerase
LPIIVQAVANNTPLTVFGDDYPTPDGTCLRDYIHVVDLAKAHVAALKKSLGEETGMYAVYNLGSGHPTSVMELIKTFEKVNNVKVPYTMGARRAGDPGAYYAVADKANHELSWHTEQTVEDAVGSAWRWQQARTS